MKKNYFKNFLFGGAMLLGMFLVAYLIGEGLVYLLYHKEMVLFPRYVTQKQYKDYAIRSNMPNESYWHKSYDGRWKFQINDQGFRSTVDFSYEKPKNILRILVLGDSFTAGYEVGQEETYSAVLQRELQKKGINAQVINAGVSGFSNAEELVFLEQEGIRYQLDVVILGFYSNDLSDNIRTGLFGLDEKENLIVRRKNYTPVAKIHDFLNSIPVYHWLSENSYLHNYLNAAATQWVVARFNQKRQEEVVRSQSQSPNLQKDQTGTLLKDYQAKLACKLVERVRKVSSDNKALFILLEIPDYSHNQVSPSWPRQTCSPESVSDIYVSGLPLLEDKASGETWYRPHGHNHWTPISHEVAGEYLASLIAKHPKILDASFVQKSQK